MEDLLYRCSGTERRFVHGLLDGLTELFELIRNRMSSANIYAISHSCGFEALKRQIQQETQNVDHEKDIQTHVFWLLVSFEELFGQMLYSVLGPLSMPVLYFLYGSKVGLENRAFWPSSGHLAT